MSASAIFATCVAKLSDNDNPLTALRSSMLRTVGERDFSAQETAHMLLGLPLFSCTALYVSHLMVALPFRLRELATIVTN